MLQCQTLILEKSEMGNETSGIILALGLIALLLILAAIFLPIPVDWKLFCGFAGLAIILFMIAGAIFSSSWIVGLIVVLLALAAGGVAVNFFLKAANIPVQ